MSQIEPPHLHFLLHLRLISPPFPIYIQTSRLLLTLFLRHKCPSMPFPLYSVGWASFHPSSRISLHITSSEESSRIPPILEAPRWRKGTWTWAECHSSLNAITRPRCPRLPELLQLPPLQNPGQLARGQPLCLTRSKGSGAARTLLSGCLRVPGCG